MYTLAFDTTAAACSIILMQDQKVMAKYSKTMDFGQAEALIPEIKNMLEANNLQFSELGLVVVCVGPGSFTGVRAGISAARAFGIALPELPVAGVSAFEAYIRELSDEELAEKNVVVIETKREDFYYQIFNKNREKVTLPAAGTYEDILELLKGGKKVTFIGDGVERFLMRSTGLSIHCIKMSDSVAVENIAAVGLQQYQDKQISFPKPVYLRAPDVCRK